MRRILTLTLLLLGVTAVAASAQTVSRNGPPADRPAGQYFVDADGDGICDHFQVGTPGAGMRAQRGGKRGGYGPGDGTGHQGIGPRDGSGYGPGAASGNCTGTGPHGQGRGRRR